MTVTRISGMASGFDTESIIKDLMKAERAKVDKYGQDKQLMVWKQEAYNNINKDFANFILDVRKEFGFSTKTYLSKPTSQTWVKKAVSSSTDVAEVSSRADAVNGNYTVNVQKLAAAWDSASSANISTVDKSNVASQFDGINDGDNIKFTITTNKGSVTIDETNLSSVKLQDIVSKINKSDIGVRAAYDATADRFFLQTTDTGTGSTIEIKDESTLSDGTKFITGANSKLKLQYKNDLGAMEDVADSNEYSGKNAVLDIGAAVGIEQQTNQFSVNGINYDLKAVGTTTVSVSTDVDGVYDKIKAFVDRYNELIDKINSTISEERYRNYQPLTKDQKDEMSEDEIKLWEAKAKSGLIRKDETISKALQSMRSGLYEKVVDGNGDPVGTNDELFEIGITTGDYRNKGKLEINEDRLKTAIMNDVDGVFDLLFSQSTITKSDSSLTAEEKAQKRAESGIINRLFDDIITGMKGVINKSGTGDNAELYRSVKSSILVDFVSHMGSTSYLDKDIDSKDKRIYREEERLIKMENYYWSKFTAMEKAVQSMSAQSAWIASQFSS